MKVQCSTCLYLERCKIYKKLDKKMVKIEEKLYSEHGIYATLGMVNFLGCKEYTPDMDVLGINNPIVYEMDGDDFNE